MLLLTLFVCIGCEWQFSSSDDDVQVTVERYDRIQSLYLTTGDFSALQQMNTIYPMQTRTLIEDVLRIGKVDDQQINTKFLRFYQDSTLQSIISEAEQQYANMDDINKGLTSAFAFLKSNLPNMEVPKVYSQIGSLDQSIIVGNNTIGICLDKYLGENYPLYQKPEYGYNKRQQQMNTIYPMQTRTLIEDVLRIGKVNDQQINTKFLRFYQDSTLQSII
jgi:DNA-directed RNA polymerase delta subunit